MSQHYRITHATLNAEERHGAKICVHGNGFIQITPITFKRLDSAQRPEARIHVWHPDCPRQKVPTTIHNHVFGFRSTIFAGQLTNRTMEIAIPWEPNQLSMNWREYWLAAGWGERGLDVLAQRVLARERYCELHRTGDSYCMEPGWFHESDSPTGFAVTLMQKTPSWPDRKPVVLIPVGHEPDNEFDRFGYDEKSLWRMAHEALDRR